MVYGLVFAVIIAFYVLKVVINQKFKLVFMTDDSYPDN